MLAKVAQEYRSIQSAYTFYVSVVGDAAPPTCLAAAELIASKTKDVCDAAIRERTIHEKEVARCGTLGKGPIQSIPFIQPVPLALNCGLYPDFELGAVEPLKLDYSDPLRNVRPIVLPAHKCSHTLSLCDGAP